MMVVHLYSPDKSRDTLFISNYANIRVIDVLNRINGVGSITVFGGRDYSMRVWLDPDRLQSLGLTAGDVVAALQAPERAGGVRRAQPAAGRISRAPSRWRCRRWVASPIPSSSPTSSSSRPPTAVVRLRMWRASSSPRSTTRPTPISIDDPAVALGIFQLPGSNALATAKAIKATMEELAKDFPEGLKYTIVYNPTEFIQQSVDAVIETIVEAVVLVVLVVILFLQTWRAADHSDRRHPGVAHRHLLLHGGVRLLAQQSVAVRTRARDRHRRRRRHRRGGERRAQHRGRPVARARRRTGAWTRSARR